MKNAVTIQQFKTSTALFGCAAAATGVTGPVDQNKVNFSASSKMVLELSNFTGAEQHAAELTGVGATIFAPFDIQMRKACAVPTASAKAGFCNAAVVV